METDCTLYKIFDIVASPGFGSATITIISPINSIRKRKIKNLFNLSDTITK